MNIYRFTTEGYERADVLRVYMPPSDVVRMIQQCANALSYGDPPNGKTHTIDIYVNAMDSTDAADGVDRCETCHRPTKHFLIVEGRRLCTPCGDLARLAQRRSEHGYSTVVALSGPLDPEDAELRIELACGHAWDIVRTPHRFPAHIGERVLCWECGIRWAQLRHDLIQSRRVPEDSMPF